MPTSVFLADRTNGRAYALMRDR